MTFNVAAKTQTSLQNSTDLRAHLKTLKTNRLQRLARRNLSDTRHRQRNSRTSHLHKRNRAHQC